MRQRMGSAERRAAHSLSSQERVTFIVSSPGSNNLICLSEVTPCSFRLPAQNHIFQQNPHLFNKYGSGVPWIQSLSEQGVMSEVTGHNLPTLQMGRLRPR